MRFEHINAAAAAANGSAPPAVNSQTAALLAGATPIVPPPEILLPLSPLKSDSSSKRAVLRLRFHDEIPKCFVTFKANAVLANGVSRVEEDEEEMDPGVGKACLEDSRKLMDADSRVLRRVREEFGVKEFASLGGFRNVRNVRNVYKWNEVKLEVNEVNYEFGDMYEIECESVGPERVKGMITQFLKKNGIHYSDSVMSKFAIFRAGKLPT